MFDQHDRDTGLSVDAATGESDLAIELRRYGLEGADVAECD